VTREQLSFRTRAFRHQLLEVIDMAHPAPALDRERFREALTTFLGHVMPECERVEYRLVGTGAALLHGVSLPVADIDILARERRGVDAFASALSPFRCLEAPAWLACSRQYYASYYVDGVEVGLSTVEIDSEADTRETFGRGPWERFSIVPCGRYSVPAVALELRLVTELIRNRQDRSDPLIRHMQQHGCDLEFLRRGLEAAAIPAAVRGEVLCSLGELHPSMQVRRAGDLHPETEPASRLV
jgi:hypothetical protein